MVAKKKMVRRRWPRKKGKKTTKISTRLPNLDIQGGLGGFAKATMVKLRYAEEFSLDATAGSLTYYAFRANSIFDPNYTGTGHQPMNFDAWALIYNHYTVLSSKVTLYAINETNANITPGYFGVVLSDDPTVVSGYSSVTDIFENPNTSNPRLAGSIVTGPPSAQKTVTKSFSANSFFGTTNVEDGGAYGALVATNPGKEAFYSCYCSAVSGNDPGVIPFLAVIDYVVLFDQRVQGTQN